MDKPVPRRQWSISTALAALKLPTGALCMYALFVPVLSLSAVQLPFLAGVPVSFLFSGLLILVLLAWGLTQGGQVRLSPITVPLMIYVGVAMLGFVRSGESLEVVVLLCGYWSLHLLSYWAASASAAGERALTAFALAAVVVGILGTASYLTGWPDWETTAAFRIGAERIARLQGPSSNPNVLANLFILGIPVAIAQLLERRALVSRFLWGGGALVSMIALLFTFSRGALVGTLAGLGIMAILIRKRIRWRYILAGAVGMGILFAVMQVSLVPVLSERLSAIGTPSVVVPRMEQLVGAGRAFYNAPLLGAGLGRAESAVAEQLPEAKEPYPHNNILLIGVELGILGLVPLLVVWLIILVVLLRAARQTKGRGPVLPAAVVAAVVGFLIAGLSHFNLHWGALWLFTALGLAVAQQTEAARGGTPCGVRRLQGKERCHD